MRVQVSQETPDLTRREGTGGKTRRRMGKREADQQTLELPAVEMIWQQIKPYQPTHTPARFNNKQRQWRTRAELRRIKEWTTTYEGIGHS